MPYPLQIFNGDLGGLGDRVERIGRGFLVNLPYPRYIPGLNLPKRDGDIRQDVVIYRYMHGSLDIWALALMLGGVEGVEELATRPYRPPLAQGVYQIISVIPFLVPLEIRYRLSVIKAIRAIRRPYDPEIIKIGGLDDNHIRAVRLVSLFSWVVYGPLGIDPFPPYLGIFLWQYLTRYAILELPVQMIVHLGQCLGIKYLFLDPMILRYRVK